MSSSVAVVAAVPYVGITIAIRQLQLPMTEQARRQVSVQVHI